MARKRITDAGAQQEVNLTPMIDCTFQLIIFFIITAQMASAKAKLVLTKPYKSQAVMPEKGGPDTPTSVFKSIQIHLVNKHGDTKKRETAEERKASRKLTGCVVSYGQTMNKEKIPWNDSADGREKFAKDVIKLLKDRLMLYIKDEMQTETPTAQQIAQAKKKVFIEVRADKDLNYDSVVPVLRIAAKEGYKNMALTAVAMKKNERNKDE